MRTSAHKKSGNINAKRARRSYASFLFAIANLWPLTWLACSGDDAGVGNPADGAAGDAITDVNINDSPVADSGAVDALSLVDGPTFPNDPGSFPCASGSCEAPSQVCCVPNDASTLSCEATENVFAACQVDPGFAGCDEPADCPGQLCAVYGATSTVALTNCVEATDAQVAAFHDAGWLQGCSHSSDCINGGPCILSTCAGMLVGLCGFQGDAAIACPPISPLTER